MPILHEKKHVMKYLGGEAQRGASPLKLITSKSLKPN
jgi:hypothetical protein